MTPFQAYIEYLALKSHFTSPSYDYKKYGGKVGASPDSFEKRKDKYFFTKLARHSDLHNFLIANFLHNTSAHPQQLTSKEAQTIYLQYRKNMESLSYNFEKELHKLNPSLKTNLKVEDGSHPLLFRLYLGEEISLQTLLIVLRLTSYLDTWNDELSARNDIVWETSRVKIYKYNSLFEFDRHKFTEMLVKHFKILSNKGVK